ncbi:MAG: hypothetical protein D4R67_05560 [Bacteroidetes bacterium]|nr:MAG: hypothetical protein D4R67_05560 [Bacteroidota bacterium]
MKHPLSLLLVFFMIQGIFAQDPDADTLPASAAQHETGDLSLPSKRMQTYVTIGTQFSNSAWLGSGLTTFIAPSVSYQVSPRFSIKGGLTLSNTTLFNYRPWYSLESGQTSDVNFTRALVYLEGSYRINDRLTLSGAGFKEFTVQDNSTFYNPCTRNSPQGIYLNADYRIADGVHIQAGFTYTRGYNPYYNSPFPNPSPFYGPSPLYDPSPFSGGAFHSSPFNW